MNDIQKIKLKIKAQCKKYPPGTKQEDIDNGKVKPYKVTTKEAIVYADDRWISKLNRTNGNR